MTFRLEPLRSADLARCAALEAVLFPGDDPWSEHAFRSELDCSRNFYVGAHVDEVGLVGYAGIGMAGKPPEADVHTIGVDPGWQGHGIGKALLRTLLARADEAGAPVHLEVRTDNEAAIGLYLTHGFEHVGVRRRYYQPSGADAYTMSRPARSSEGVR